MGGLTPETRKNLQTHLQSYDSNNNPANDKKQAVSTDKIMKK